MFDPKSHPRDSRGRFARKLTVAAENKRDEISVPVTDSDDFHEFVETPGEDGFPVCGVCGDSESANDHQDPNAHARVWMDVEGLTLSDIDSLDHYVAVVTRKLDEAGEYDTAELDVAQLVADWIGGVTSETERSELLAYSGALDGLMAFVSDVLAERNAVVESPSGWSFRASQENGDQVDCRECGNPLDDNRPIVNDSDGYAYHEGCLPIADNPAPPTSHH